MLTKVLTCASRDSPRCARLVARRLSKSHLIYLAPWKAPIAPLQSSQQTGRALHISRPQLFAGPARYAKAVKRQQKTKKRWKQKQKKRKEERLSSEDFYGVLGEHSERSGQINVNADRGSFHHAGVRSAQTQGRVPDRKTLSFMLDELDPLRIISGESGSMTSTGSGSHSVSRMPEQFTDRTGTHERQNLDNLTRSFMKKKGRFDRDDHDKKLSDQVQRLLNASALSGKVAFMVDDDEDEEDDFMDKFDKEEEAALEYERRIRHAARRSIRLQSDISEMLCSGRVKLSKGVDASEIIVQKVELSGDGRNATIWWDIDLRETSFKERAIISGALSRASYKIRMIVAKARRMRVAPRLEWKWGGETISEREDTMASTMESIRDSILLNEPEWNPDVESDEDLVGLEEEDLLLNTDATVEVEDSQGGATAGPHSRTNTTEGHHSFPEVEHSQPLHPSQHASRKYLTARHAVLELEDL